MSTLFAWSWLGGSGSADKDSKPSQRKDLDAVFSDVCYGLGRGRLGILLHSVYDTVGNTALGLFLEPNHC